VKTRGKNITPPITTARAASTRLAQLGDPESAEFSKRFFKTGKGEYGEGDRFRGLSVPAMRQVARACAEMSLGETLRLLKSPYHEDRLVALLILVRRYSRGDDAVRQRILDAYLASTRYINSWDLVDVSAPSILGAHLERRSRAVLAKLARSPSLWERRIAIVSTAHFIRNGDPKDALRIAKMLLDDEQDLIHKAAGWMLREVGARCSRDILREFLDAHAAVMPRTMLRYSLEHFAPDERAKYLAMRSKDGTPRRTRRRQ
jgi:3-methyladenine DNA glycosylase AlkD